MYLNLILKRFQIQRTFHTSNIPEEVKTNANALIQLTFWKKVEKNRFNGFLFPS